MFVAMCCLFAALTATFLTYIVNLESKQRSIIDRMNKSLIDSDPALFTGNSRIPDAK